MQVPNNQCDCGHDDRHNHDHGCTIDVAMDGDDGQWITDVMTNARCARGVHHSV